MKRLAILAFALMASVGGAVAPAAASAESTPLPLIRTALSGEQYPLVVQGEARQTAEGDIELSDSSAALPAEAVSILLFIAESSALGSALIDFAGVHEGTEKCNTAGDASGVVLVPSGEFHLVYTSLSPSSTLETAALILFPKFIINCGLLESTLESPLMARISPVSGNSANGGDSTGIELTAHCSNVANGIQAISSYYNDSSLELTKQLLKANMAGTGNENACEEIKPTILLTIAEGCSAAEMFTVLQ